MGPVLLAQNLVLRPLHQLLHGETAAALHLPDHRWTRQSPPLNQAGDHSGCCAQCVSLMPTPLEYKETTQFRKAIPVTDLRDTVDAQALPVSVCSDPEQTPEREGVPEKTDLLSAIHQNDEPLIHFTDFMGMFCFDPV